MIRDRYPWPRRPFLSSYRASFSVAASSFPSLALRFSFYVPQESFRATTSMPLDARALWRWVRKRERGRAVGLVSIMGWNMKRMQTWNNTTLDRAFRCGILPLSFLPHRFSLPYRGPGGILRVSPCPHHICRGPSSKRWNVKLKTMLKQPPTFSEIRGVPFSSLWFSYKMIRMAIRGAIKIYRGIFALRKFMRIFGLYS